MVKRILVTLPDETAKIINSIKTIGNTDAERIRMIVISWLSEKSILSSEFKKRK